MTQVLTSVTPILFVRNVLAGARYFEECLGFTIDFLHGAPPFYGSVSRDGVCLHLRFVEKPNFADLAAGKPSLILATIEVADLNALHALHAGLRERGAHVVQPPTKQPWGGTDFHVADPDGNVVSFVAYDAE